jgi:hypothetical protein
MITQYDRLDNSAQHSKCDSCGAQLVSIQVPRYHYLAMHTTAAGARCEATVAFAIKPAGGQHTLVDPCPTCKEPQAKFLDQGSTAVSMVACPKGCR